jgi:hypothetical protein
MAATKELAILVKDQSMQKPYPNWIFIIADANVVADGLATGYMQANPHIPQHLIR